MHYLQRNLRNRGSHARNLTDYTKIVLHRAMLLPQCTYRLCAEVSCSDDSGALRGGVVEIGVSYCLTCQSKLHTARSRWTFVSIHIYTYLYIHLTCSSPRQNLNIIPLRILSGSPSLMWCSVELPLRVCYINKWIT